MGRRPKAGVRSAVAVSVLALVLPLLAVTATPAQIAATNGAKAAPPTIDRWQSWRSMGEPSRSRVPGWIAVRVPGWVPGWVLGRVLGRDERGAAAGHARADRGRAR